MNKYTLTILTLFFSVMAFASSGSVDLGPTIGGGGTAGVSSLNSLTGALNITAGSGISVTPSGSSIQITNTGGGGSTFLDNAFKIENFTDITKILKTDLSGETTGTSVTLQPLTTQNTTFILRPTVDATANIITQNATSGQIFIGADASLGGANSGIQYSNATTANRGQIRLGSYVNATSVAGVTTATSRSGTVGVNAAVVAGQDYSKWTAQAGATTPGSLPISGAFAFKANTVNSLTVTTDYHIQLANLAGTIGDRLYLGSEGALQLPFYSTGIMHSDASGNLTSSPVSLTADVSGILPVANGGSGVASTSQNFFFAGPTSGSGAPSFRAITTGDIKVDDLTVYATDLVTPQIKIDGTSLPNPFGVPILSSISNPRLDNDPTNSSLAILTANNDTTADSGSIGLATGSNLGGTGTHGSGTILMFTGNVDPAGSGISGNLQTQTGTGPASGQIVFSTGDAATGSSGQIVFQSGHTIDATSGQVLFSTGIPTGTGSSGEFILESGNTVSGTSGSVNIQSGTSTAGSSGDVKINAGGTGPTSFAGEVAIGTAPQMNTGSTSDTGVIQLETGPVLDATSTGASGAVTIASGDNIGLGNSGEIRIKSGSGVVSGDVSFLSGNPSNGASGQLFFETGVITTASSTFSTGQILQQTGFISDAGSSGNTGPLLYSSGNNSGTGGSGELMFISGTTVSGSSGSVNIASGNSGSGGSGGVSLSTGTGATRGQIQFVDGTEGTAGYCWTSTDTSGHGSWQACGAGSGANQALSNLTSPTAINQDLIFDTGTLAHLVTKDSLTATQQLVVSTGNQTDVGGTDSSGNILIATGNVANATGTAGTVNIGAGNNTANSANSGGVSIFDGNGLGSIQITVTDISFTDPAGTDYMTVNAGQRIVESTAGDSMIDFSSSNRLITFNHIENSNNVNPNPSVSSCGTSPTVTGSDVAGVATIGTGVVTSCTITFGTSWTNLPHCFVNDQTTSVIVHAAPTSTTVVLKGTFTAGDLVDYYCIGNP